MKDISVVISSLLEEIEVLKKKSKGREVELPTAEFVLKMLGVLNKIPNNILTPEITLEENGNCNLTWNSPYKYASVFVSFYKEVKKKKVGRFSYEISKENKVAINVYGDYGEFSEKVNSVDEILDIIVPVLDNRGFYK